MYYNSFISVSMLQGQHPISAAEQFSPPVKSRTQRGILLHSRTHKGRSQGRPPTLPYLPASGLLPHWGQTDMSKTTTRHSTPFSSHLVKISSSPNGRYAPSFASSNTVPDSRHFKLCHCPASIFNTTPPGTISTVSVRCPSES